MQRFIVCTVVAATMIFSAVAPSFAQRGRNTYTPYVMTPNGPMLRSQYMMMTMQFVDPAMIALMQQQEQAFLNRGKKTTAPAGGNTGVKPTGAKPAVKPAANTTAGKPAAPVKK